MITSAEIARPAEFIPLLAKDNNGYAGAPMDTLGRVGRWSKDGIGTVYPAWARLAVIAATLRMYYLKTGYDLHPLPPVKELRQIPNVSDMEFLSLHTSDRAARISSQNFLQEITQLANDFRHDGRTLYSPYFLTQDVAATQLENTDRVQGVKRWVLHDVNAFKEGKKPIFLSVLDEPQEVLVINSMSTGSKLPMSEPYNPNKGDFDSGQCNYGLNFGGRKGDRLTVDATWGADWVFTSDGNAAGWMHKDDVVFFDTKLDQHIAQYKPVFYKHQEPHFYKAGNKRKIIMPGDEIYEKDGGYFTLEKSSTGIATFHPLKINETQVTQHTQDVQSLINYFFGLKTPYIWGNSDCSQEIKRMFRMYGITLTAYSGTMIKELAQMFHGTSEAITRFDKDNRDFSTLTDGIYIVEESIEDVSTHISVVTIQDGKITVGSKAFALNGEFPVGFHRGDEQVLQKRIDGGKMLQVVQVASRKDKFAA